MEKEWTHIVVGVAVAVTVAVAVAVAVAVIVVFAAVFAVKVVALVVVVADAHVSGKNSKASTEKEEKNTKKKFARMLKLFGWNFFLLFYS